MITGYDVIAQINKLHEHGRAIYPVFGLALSEGRFPGGVYLPARELLVVNLKIAGDEHQCPAIVIELDVREPVRTATLGEPYDFHR